MPWYKMRKCLKTAFAAILVFAIILAAKDRKGSGIHVELIRAPRLCLHITLMSGANGPVKVERSELPWSAGDSLVVAALMGNGECLRRSMPVDDPLFDEISVDPNKPLSGDIDLERLFPDIRRVSQVKDVQVFWAYRAPEALQIGQWSGGWFIIPRRD